MIDHQHALIYAMLMVSASDGNMTDAEMHTIGNIVRTLPVFEDFDVDDELPKVSRGFVALIAKEDGLNETLAVIKKSLPGHLCETAYALAVDVVASDTSASQEELRLLELMRHQLDVERLVAAAIERGAAARFIRPGSIMSAIRAAS